MLDMFNKKSVGLDIADRSIEVVKLNKSGRQVKIVSLSRMKLAPGIVERGQIKDAQKLIQALTKVLAQAKPEPIAEKDFIFGLPEALVYTHVAQLKPGNQAEFKKLSAKDKDAYVLKEALKLIPLEASDLLLDYRVHVVDKGKLNILMVGASRQAVASWQQFFTEHKIEVVFDIESLAIARGLFDKPLEAGVCVVDIGAATSMIMIFDPTGLRFSYQVGQAGRSFTQAVKRKFGNTYQESEKLKIQTGLSEPNSEIYLALESQITKLVNEIKTLIKYYRRTTSFGAEEIILVGGSSRLKGLAEYIESSVGIATKPGKARLVQGKTVAVSQRYMYIEAIGLAWRGLDGKWEKQDPALELKVQKHKSLKDKKKKAKNINPPKTNQAKSAPSTQLSKKIRRQKIILVQLLVLGIGIIGGAFWFRVQDRAQRGQELESAVVEFTQTQTLNLQVNVAIDPTEHTAGRVPGRIFRHTVTEAESFDEALELSEEAANDSLNSVEALWSEPISPAQEPDEFVLPLEVSWLVYSEPDANQQFLNEVNKLNSNNVTYELDSIAKDGLAISDNPKIYHLTGKVTLLLNDLIEISETLGSETADDDDIVTKQKSEPTQKVKISNTPTGWLNARAGPGTNYAIITRVFPDEEYELLEESGSWYNIYISTTKQAWISSQYAAKIDE
jgi:type IV pilus assembly protein PilM